MFPYIITDQKITVVFDGRAHSVYQSDSDTTFAKVKSAISQNDEDLIKLLISPAEAVKSAVQNLPDIVYEHGYVWYKGVQVNNYVVDRILKLKEENIDVSRLEKFMVRLYNNPNKEVIPFLYEFLEYGGNPITEAGTFLAYKRVTSNFKDIHTGKFDNSPGTIVTERRELVNSDRNTVCAKGLHFCSWEYLSHFGSSQACEDRVIIIEVDPEDVVMIPKDYNNTKARCCKYKVLYDYGKAWKDINQTELKLELSKVAVDINPPTASSEGSTILKAILEAVKMWTTMDTDLNVAPTNITSVSKLCSLIDTSDALDFVEVSMAIEDKLQAEFSDHVIFNETLINEFFTSIDGDTTIDDLYLFIIKNADNIFDKPLKLETYDEDALKGYYLDAVTNTAIPAKAPSLEAKSAYKIGTHRYVKIINSSGLASSGREYWNGLVWKSLNKHEKMRNSRGWFVPDTYLATDGFYTLK